MEEVKKYKHKKNIFLCVQATIPKDIDKNASENKAYLDDTEYREYSIKAFEAIMQDLRHIKHLGKDEILGPAVKDGETAGIVTYSPEPDNRTRSFWMFGVYSRNGTGQSLEETIIKYDKLVKKKG